MTACYWPVIKSLAPSSVRRVTTQQSPTQRNVKRRREKDATMDAIEMRRRRQRRQWRHRFKLTSKVTWHGRNSSFYIIVIISILLLLLFFFFFFFFFFFISAERTHENMQRWIIRTNYRWNNRRWKWWRCLRSSLPFRTPWRFNAILSCSFRHFHFLFFTSGIGTELRWGGGIFSLCFIDWLIGFLKIGCLLVFGWFSRQFGRFFTLNFSEIFGRFGRFSTWIFKKLLATFFEVFDKNL